MMDDRQMAIAYYQGDLDLIENQILPDLRQRLERLTGPDYKAENNPFHETREEDIQHLVNRIKKNEGLAATYRKYIEQAEKGATS
jgi:hypothetical protein